MIHWRGEYRVSLIISFQTSFFHDRMKAVARTVRYHVREILNWYDCRMYNGFIEGLNGMIQCTKRVGRGFPNTDNFINMIWFKHGRLEII